MTKDIKPFERIMDRAWMRDKNNQIYTGEALVIAMLLKVRKRRNRTESDEKELREILDK